MSAPAHNRLSLHARLSARQPLRYTPAGVPAQDLELSHESQQQEAGQNRQIHLTLRAVAFGLVAEQLAQQPLDQMIKCSGFLAAGRGGKGSIFHIQTLEF
mgnify:CR=1 FL=1